MTPEEIKTLTVDDIINLGEFECSCGKKHAPGVAKAVIRKGAVEELPALLKEAGAKKPFILSGHDTFAAAGELVCGILEKAGYPYCKYVFPVSPVRPTEYTVGSAFLTIRVTFSLPWAPASSMTRQRSLPAPPAENTSLWLLPPRWTGLYPLLLPWTETG